MSMDRDDVSHQNSPLLKAASEGDTETVRSLLNSHGLHEEDCFGRQALHLACKGGHLSLVQFLVSSGAGSPCHCFLTGFVNDFLDVNQISNNQSLVALTPLMYAAKYGHRDVCHFLLSVGADCDIQTSDGTTAQDLCDEFPLDLVSDLSNSSFERSPSPMPTGKGDRTPGRRNRSSLTVDGSNKHRSPRKGLSYWLMRPFFWKLRLRRDDREVLQSMSRTGSIVYVTRHSNYVSRGLVDVALLNTHSPSPVATANAPLGRTPLDGTSRLPEDGLLYESIVSRRPVLTYLSKPDTWFRRVKLGSRQQGDSAYGNMSGCELIAELLELQESLDSPIFLCPLAYATQRKPKRTWTWFRSLQLAGEAVFGTREAPGALRELWHYFASCLLDERQHYCVRLGPVYDLSAALEKVDGPNRRAQLSSEILGEIDNWMAQEFRLVNGPTLPHVGDILQDVCGSAIVKREVEEAASEMAKAVKQNYADAPPCIELSREVAMERTQKMVLAMAGNMRITMIRLMGWMLRRTCRSVFDGIQVDPNELDRVRATSEIAPICLVPTHKSHFDYLILSYLFYTRAELMCPYVAAGDNLRLPIIGNVLKWCGAFYLRRSFKNDQLYRAVFSSYVQHLSRNGYSLEFFIEGGRSRTGAVCAPKMGLLQVLTESVAKGEADDMYIIPTSISYDKVLEMRDHVVELKGGLREPESVFKLIKQSLQMFRSNYGNVAVRFGQPISIRDFIREQSDPRSKHSDKEAMAPTISKLATCISFDMEQNTVIMPTAVVAAVLLSANAESPTSWAELRHRCSTLALAVTARGGEVFGMSASVEALWQQEKKEEGYVHRLDPNWSRVEALHLSPLARSITRALLLMEDHLVIHRETTISGIATVSSVEVRQEQSSVLALSYHRSQMIHLFLEEGIVYRVYSHLSTDEPNEGKHRPQVLERELASECDWLAKTFCHHPRIGSAGPVALWVPKAVRRLCRDGVFTTCRVEGQAAVSKAPTPGYLPNTISSFVTPLIDTAWAVGHVCDETLRDGFAEAESVVLDLAMNHVAANCTLVSMNRYFLKDALRYLASRKCGLLSECNNPYPTGHSKGQHHHHRLWYERSKLPNAELSSWTAKMNDYRN